MQSGIRATNELHRAFNELAATPSQRGLLVGIQDEQLIPLQPIPSSSSDFPSDLSALAHSLKDDEAAYVILRRYSDVPDGFVAVTYVPDHAKVRQKTLFASTRLTLVRELGSEKFRETLFATTKAELTAEGFQKHDRHTELKAPLTEEEKTLQDVKEAEAAASRGTSGRASHVIGVSFPITDEGLQALEGLKDGKHNVVQLMIDVPTETLELVEAGHAEVDSLVSKISETEPRYTFFRYDHDYEGRQESPVIFIYTCPGESKIKERMLYASVRRSMLAVASDKVGIPVEKKLEASSPSDFTASLIHEELHPRKETTATFSRPKRPGRK